MYVVMLSLVYLHDAFMRPGWSLHVNAFSLYVTYWPLHTHTNTSLTTTTIIVYHFNNQHDSYISTLLVLIFIVCVCDYVFMCVSIGSLLVDWCWPHAYSSQCNQGHYARCDVTWRGVMWYHYMLSEPCCCHFEFHNSNFWWYLELILHAKIYYHRTTWHVPTPSIGFHKMTSSDIPRCLGQIEPLGVDDVYGETTMYIWNGLLVATTVDSARDQVVSYGIMWCDINVNVMWCDVIWCDVCFNARSECFFRKPMYPSLW